MNNTHIAIEELQPLLDKLNLEDNNERWEAEAQLKLQVRSIREEDRERLLALLEGTVKSHCDYHTYDAIVELAGVDRLKQISDASTMVGWYLINRQSLLEQLWKEDTEYVIRFLIPVLNDNESAPLVIDWLSNNAENIPKPSYNSVIRALQSNEIDTPPEIKLKKETALTQIGQFKSRIFQKPLFEILDKGADVDLQIDAVQDLLKLESRQVTRDLVNRWCEWVVYGDRPLLTETTPEYLRMSTQAVLPLVENISKKRELSDRLRSTILHQVLPIIQFNLVVEVFPEFRGAQESYVVPEISQENYQVQTRKFLDSLGDRSDAFKNLKTQADSMQWDWKEIVKKATEQLFLEELSLREEKVQLRVLKQIADMSEKRFFDNNDTLYEEMLKELRKHAVPVMAARLPKEANVNQREYMARLLGNVGGQEANDALVLAVVGEERTRAARQELLAKYYLDPSKQRSEEAAQILSQAVDDARQTLKVLRWLNITVFAVGILLLLLGTITALISQELSTRVVGVLAGLGGLTGILVEMIKSPLEGIQNSMANLVQIETAFTSFIWELNLNGTFIQSQYVAEGTLQDYEITQTVKRIEDAMILAMNQVSVYTKVGRQRILSRIYDLSPAAGSAGSNVIIHGQHMTGDKTDKKENTGILVIDHKPIKAENLKWSDQEVSFKLPQKVNATEKMNETIWISLFIDGMETNALPFHVIEEGK